MLEFLRRWWRPEVSAPTSDVTEEQKTEEIKRELRQGVDEQLDRLRVIEWQADVEGHLPRGVNGNGG